MRRLQATQRRQQQEQDLARREIQELIAESGVAIFIRGHRAVAGHTEYSIFSQLCQGGEEYRSQHRFNDFLQLHAELPLMSAFPVAKTMIVTDAVKTERVYQLQAYLRKAAAACNNRFGGLTPALRDFLRIPGDAASPPLHQLSSAMASLNVATPVATPVASDSRRMPVAPVATPVGAGASASGRPSVEPHTARSRQAEISRRHQKTAAALDEDGFAMRPLDEREDRATWSALAQFLTTSDQAQLGKGKDVTRAYGEYNELRLVSAWHIEHPRSLQRYEAAKEIVLQDMKLLDRKSVHSFGMPPRGLPVATASAAARFNATPAASESFLLHGTNSSVLLSLLKNGLNERYSGSNAGTAFGDGVYLAEDVAKTDQYAAPDVRFDGSSELHRRLYGNTNRHQGSVFYVLVCRVLLGYPARTQQAGQRATHMETGEHLFPIGFRELSTIPNVTPPTNYHSLIAELGQAIVRYREFVVFRGEYVCPEYLLAYQRCRNGNVVTV